MHGLTGGDWKRAANAEPRQSPTLPLCCGIRLSAPFRAARLTSSHARGLYTLDGPTYPDITAVIMVAECVKSVDHGPPVCEVS